MSCCALRCAAVGSPRPRRPRPRGTAPTRVRRPLSATRARRRAAATPPREWAVQQAGEQAATTSQTTQTHKAKASPAPRAVCDVVSRRLEAAPHEPHTRERERERVTDREPLPWSIILSCGVSRCSRESEREREREMRLLILVKISNRGCSLSGERVLVRAEERDAGLAVALGRERELGGCEEGAPDVRGQHDALG